jgi:hypothetical protein
MARIRYLKPEFFIDEDIAALPFAIRIFYQGLWCHADKEGRLEDRPAQLKVQIMPYDKIDAEDFLNELCRKPFIQRYEIGGIKYIQIIAWHKHQKPHHTEKESDIPPPPDKLLNEVKDFKDKDKDKDKATQSELEVKAPLNNGYKPKKTFEIPTVEQIQDYINAHKYNVNALRFHAYYTSNGWRVGKNPMKNWKAAIVTWQNKE